MIEAGGNVYYLAKLAGIFGSQRAGHRRAADRHERRRVQSETSRQQGDDPWRRSSAASGRPRPLDRQSDCRGKQNDPYWKPFFKGFDYVHYWLAREKPDVAVVFYNDHGLNFFLDKLPTFAVGAAANTATRTKAGAFRCRADSRACRAVVACHQHAGRRRVRHHHVPGHADRSRGDHSDGADVAGRQAGRSRSCRSRSTPCSIRCRPCALPGARPFGRPGARIASGVIARDGRRHRRPVASARRQSGPASSTRNSTALSGQIVGRAGDAGALFDPRSGRSCPARKVWNFSIGWRCAGTLTGRVSEVNRNYHIPVSNTAAATVVYDNQKTAERKAA